MRLLLCCLPFILLCGLFIIFQPAAKPFPTMTLPAANDEADQALEDARTFMRKGEFAKALERHEWYHANALRINRAHYGVRLSFALGDWMELGEKYPPALASLRRIRDENVRTLMAGTGSRELFHDVESINDRFSESAASVVLFRKLDATQPELAEKCFDLVSDTLIEKNEIELYVRYIGDFKTHLAGEIESFKEMTAWMRKEGVSERRGELRKSMLVATTLALARIATEKGDPALAAELKAMTYKVVPDPSLR